MGLNNYTLINYYGNISCSYTKTGDKKEVVMSVNDWDQWCTDNPDWSRDYSDPSTVPGVGEVGEWRNKLIRRKPGWNEVLERVQKYPGAQKQKID